MGLGQMAVEVTTARGQIDLGEPAVGEMARDDMVLGGMAQGRQSRL